jgi:hypothetical protein
MSFTIPMPLSAPSASLCAQVMISSAAWTAVSKPKVFSTKRRSLSMVLGIPMTLMGRLRRAISSAIA